MASNLSNSDFGLLEKLAGKTRREFGRFVQATDCVKLFCEEHDGN